MSRCAVRSLLWMLFAGLLAACQPAAPQPTPTPPPAARQLLLARGDLFSSSGECAGCHTGLKDESGADVSIDAHWRATMMANAARDPYYRASVRSEVVRLPELRPVIEKKCATCHLGMAYTTALAVEESTAMLDDGFLSPQHPLFPLAQDGVSCTLCHQVQSDRLGTPASFSGEYVIDKTTPQGQRAIFGRFPVTESTAAIMRGASGFVPKQSEHLSGPNLCASCHTLFTTTVQADGTLAADPFPEQTPYLEWSRSQYAGQTVCQDCHMPTAQGAVRIANTGSQPQEPFFQHNFTGANAFMIGLVQANAEALQATAEDEHFDTLQQRTQQLLQEQTAQLELNAQRSGSSLDVTVKVTSQVGHKFPSGFPSRRAWLHLTVRDAAGAVLFESGQVQPDGSIPANDNDQDPARFEPHYDRITAPDQVQIYEAVMVDSQGAVTTTLLQAAAYQKDNRLLPLGFDPAQAPPEIAVQGQAAQDGNFTGGSDQVVYQVTLADPSAPLTVEVELLYQPLSYRWIEKIRAQDTPESQNFSVYLKNAPAPTFSKVAAAQLQLP